MTITNLAKAVAGIIQTYMSLDDDQVVLYSSDWKIPNDNRLYVVIRYNSVSQNVLAVKSTYNSSANTETSSIVTHERFTIELLSHGTDATDQYSEIFMAFNSQPGELAQEINNIRIFRAGSVLDLSDVEGSGSLHRIQIPIIISNVQNKTTDVDYFDKFTAENVETEE